MLKNLLLLIFGIVTLIAILNCAGVIHWLNSCPPAPSGDGTHSGGRTGFSPCNDGLRYNDFSEEGGGGKQVIRDSIIHLINNFQSTRCDSDSIRCVFFSKRALDLIFADDSTANGIVCCFGKDDQGHLQLGITGDHLTTTLIETISDPPIYFASQAHCPPACQYPK